MQLFAFGFVSCNSTFHDAVEMGRWVEKCIKCNSLLDGCVIQWKPSSTPIKILNLANRNIININPMPIADYGTELLLLLATTASYGSIHPFWREITMLPSSLWVRRCHLTPTGGTLCVALKNSRMVKSKQSTIGDKTLHFFEAMTERPTLLRVTVLT